MGLNTIANKNNVIATISDQSASLISLTIPDKNGNSIDIIRNTSEMVITDEYGIDCLAIKDFLFKVSRRDTCSLELKYISKKGRISTKNVEIKVLYNLNNSNCLKVSLEIVSDELQYILPSYPFFNLNSGKTNILKHQLFINADSFLAIEDIANGMYRPRSIINSPFNFKNPGTIGSRINDHHVALKNGKGYRHVFLLNKHASHTPIAKIRGDQSAITLEILSDRTHLLFLSTKASVENYSQTVIKNEGRETSVALFPIDIFETPNTPLPPIISIKPFTPYKSAIYYIIKQ